MDKIGMKKILQNFSGNSTDLYKATNVINKEKTHFNATCYNQLLYLSLLFYHLNFGIETLSKNNSIPPLGKKVTSYKDFMKLLEEYKKIPYHNSLLPNETCY